MYISTVITAKIHNDIIIKDWLKVHEDFQFFYSSADWKTWLISWLVRVINPPLVLVVPCFICWFHCHHWTGGDGNDDNDGDDDDDNDDKEAID